MSIDLLVMIVFALLVLLLLVWGYSIIQNLQNKIANHATSLDKLMQANHQLNKELSELRAQIGLLNQSSKSAVFNLEEITRRIDSRINEALASRVMPMLDSLKRLESSVDDFTSEHEERMQDLEERTKSISKITPPSFEAQEDKIERLYKAGKTPENIARDLRIGVGTVMMILKLRKLM